MTSEEIRNLAKKNAQKRLQKQNTRATAKNNAAARLESLRAKKDFEYSNERKNNYGVDDDIWSNVQRYSDAIGDYDWRSKHEYDMLDSADLKRKQQGRIPYSLEKRYDLEDSALDRALYYEGLPSSKDLADVAESAQKAAAKAAQEQREHEEIAAKYEQYSEARSAYNRALATVEDAEKRAEIQSQLDEYARKAYKDPDDTDSRAYYYLAEKMQERRSKEADEYLEDQSNKAYRQRAVDNYGYMSPESITSTLDINADAIKQQIDTVNPDRANIARELNDIENKIREINTSTDANARASELNALQNRRAALMGQVKAGNDTAAELEQQYINAQAAQRDARISAGLQPYASIPNADDFEEYSQKGAQATGSRKHNSINASGANKVLHAGLIDYDGYGIYDYMTDDERATYNYLYAKNGEKSADEYLETLTPALNRRYTGEVEAQNARFAEDVPVLSDAVSVLYGIPKAVSGAYAAADTLFNGGSVDPYDPMYAAGAAQSAIRNTRTEQLGDVWGFLYNTGMSILDTIMARGVGGKASLGIMGAGAMADTYQSALERGADPGQALATGALAAISEAVFEKLSLDNWIKLKTAGRGKTIKNLLRSMGVEASEEMATEVANIISDRIILGELGETHGKTLSELGGQVLLAGAGGALSGGVFTGLGAAANRISTSRANRQAAKQSEATTEQPEAVPDSTEDTTNEAATVAETPRAVAEASAAVEEAAAETPEQLAAEEAAERPRINTPLSPTVPGLTRNATPRALQEAARRLAESSGKGVNNKTMAEASGAINSQLKAIDALGKRYGISIEIRDSIEAIDEDGNVVQSALSGYYDPQTRRVVIAADATDQAYTFVATHELVHYIKDSGVESYATLESTVFEALEAAGEDVEALVRQQMEQQGYDEYSAREEVVANSVPAILTDEATVQRIVETDRTLGERIAEFFKGFAQNLRNIFKSLAKRPGWTQMDAISKQADSMERISNAFFGALEESAVQAQESSVETVEQISTDEAASDLVIADDMPENVPVKAATKEGSGVKSGEVFVDTNQASPREILAGALLDTAQNQQEREKITEYQRAIRKIDGYQTELDKVNAEIKEKVFAPKGTPRDRNTIDKLRKRAEKLRNSINWWDKHLLKLESTEILDNVVKRERAKVAKRKARQFRDWKTKNRKRELRTRIQSEAKQLLNRMMNPTEKGNKYVPERFHNVVVEVLRSIRFTSDENADAALAARKKKLDEILIPRARERYDELVATGAERSEIETAFKRLQNYLVETENVKNEASKWRDKLRALSASMTSKEMTESDMDIESGTVEALTELLEETNNILTLDEMTVEQLRELNKIMSGLKHSIIEANRTEVNGKKELISDMAQGVIAEAAESGKQGKKRTNAGRLFNWSTIKPVYAFKRMGGTLYKLFDDIVSGQRKYALLMDKAHTYYKEQYKKFHVADWINDKNKLKFTTKRGDTIELSRNEALSLYATAKREASNPDKGARHLSIGGFVFEAEQTREPGEVTDKNGKKKKVKKTTFKDAAPKPITDADMKVVEKWLTKEQTAFADELVNYMSTVLAELGNETSLKQSGFKKFGEAYYFPYVSSRDYIARNPGEGLQDNERWRHKGFTKATVAGARNPIVLQDFTKVFGQHVNDMLMYHAMAIPQENLLRVFNWHERYSEEETSMSVSAALTNAYGPEAVEYIYNFLSDLNGGLVKDSRENAVTKNISRFKKGATMASLSVIIQQPSALVRGMAMVNPKYFAVRPKWHVYDQLMKYSGTAVIKRMGGFDMGTGAGAAAYVVGAAPKGLGNKAREFVSRDSTYRDEILGAAPQKMDELAWVWIWEAVKKETAAKMGIKPGDGRYASEEHLQAAGKRFDEVIEQTQVYDSVISRSEMMRSQSGLMKMVTAFAAEPTVAYNMLYDAVTSGNVKRAGAYIAAVVASGAVNALLKSFVSAARDDDEDKGYWEKYGDAVKDEILGQPLSRTPFTVLNDKKLRPLSILNPLTMVPIARDIISMFQGYDVERTDMSMYSDIITAFDNFDSDRKTDYEKWRDLAGSIANFTGVPLRNVMRDIEAVLRLFKLEIGG